MPSPVRSPGALGAPRSHYVEVFNLLEGGLFDGGWMGEGRPKGGHALAILPGLTHYNVFSSPLFAAVTLAFLDQQRTCPVSGLHRGVPFPAVAMYKIHIPSPKTLGGRPTSRSSRRELG